MDPPTRREIVDRVAPAGVHVIAEGTTRGPPRSDACLCVTDEAVYVTTGAGIDRYSRPAVTHAETNADRRNGRSTARDTNEPTKNLIGFALFPTLNGFIDFLGAPILFDAGPRIVANSGCPVLVACSIAGPLLATGRTLWETVDTNWETDYEMTVSNDAAGTDDERRVVFDDESAANDSKNALRA
jgi:hypothetical protein